MHLPQDPLPRAVVEGAPAAVVADALGFSGATTDAAAPGVGGAAAVVTGAVGSATTAVIAVDKHDQASIDTMDKFLNLERGSSNDPPRYSVFCILGN